MEKQYRSLAQGSWFLQGNNNFDSNPHQTEDVNYLMEPLSFRREGNGSIISESQFEYLRSPSLAPLSQRISGLKECQTL